MMRRAIGCGVLSAVGWIARADDGDRRVATRGEASRELATDVPLAERVAAAARTAAEPPVEAPQGRPRLRELAAHLKESRESVYDQVRQLLAQGRIEEAIALLQGVDLDEVGRGLLAEAYSRRVSLISQLSSSPMTVRLPELLPKRERFGEGVRRYFKAILNRFRLAAKQVNSVGRTYFVRHPKRIAQWFAGWTARAGGDVHASPLILADLVRASSGDGDDLPSDWQEVESRFYPDSGYAGALYYSPAYGTLVAVHQLPTNPDLLTDCGRPIEDAEDFLRDRGLPGPTLHVGYRLGGMVAESLALRRSEEAVGFDSPGVEGSQAVHYMSEPDALNTWVEHEGPVHHLRGFKGVDAMEEWMVALRHEEFGSWEQEMQGVSRTELIERLEGKLC